VSGLLQTVFFKLSVESTLADFENTGGFLPISLGHFQCALDDDLLDFVQVHSGVDGKRIAGGGLIGCHVRWISLTSSAPERAVTTMDSMQLRISRTLPGQRY